MIFSRQDLFPWFCALYVKESERGKGLGAKLLEHGRVEAARIGYKKLFLSTSLKDFYEKHGWNYIANGFHPWGDESRIYEIETAASALDYELWYLLR